MPTLLSLVFILSGAAGLIYESIWTRYLGLFVGHGAYAQIIVLTIFLGGMSVGAFFVGRVSEKLRDPLAAYAFIELAIGIVGFLFHDIFVATTNGAYDHLFPSLAGSPHTVIIVKWTIASLLILPQSILLGATFPLMSAGVLRIVPKKPGSVLAQLYFANSLGGAFGVLIAGFWLLGYGGLPLTLDAAAMVNLVVFLLALGVARFGAKNAETSIVAEPAEITRGETSREAEQIPLSVARLLLLVAFGTAVASFIYEISWIRMLSLLLGSATHSFELMLSAFILGLALGARWVRSRADKFADPVRALGIVQCVMGLAALATVPVYLAGFKWTASFITALKFNDGGYDLFTIARYFACLVVMLPSTFCAGMTLPLITRMLIRRGDGERAIGNVYAVNTLGSIVGVVLAGLVLMPLVGLKVLLVEGAVVDMALGVMLLRLAGPSLQRRRQFAYIAAFGMTFAALASLKFNHFDEVTLSSGVYRYGSLPDPAGRQMVFYRDGRTATVAVGRQLPDSFMWIATNGKPDASVDRAWFSARDTTKLRVLNGDISTQVLIPVITLAHMPSAKLAAIIGEGSGMTSHFLLGSSTLEQAVTIEIEPQMIAGSRMFYPANRRVFDDPRSRFVVDDAKSFFATDARKYDVIISEPSNPWVSGVSGLFTDEFYHRVRGYLTPNGVFGQWLHLYEINDGLVLSVLAAIHGNFASYSVYLTSNDDMLIVASNLPQMPAPDWNVIKQPGIAADLAGVVPFTPQSLDATHLIDRRELAPLLDRFGTPNSDYRPVLDLGAERERFKRETASGFGTLRVERFDAVAAVFGDKRPFDDAERTTVPEIWQLHALTVSAALRHPSIGAAADTAGGKDARDARQRQWELQSTLALNTPPPDWKRWTLSALDVERYTHAGSAGVIDQPFYASLDSYMARTHAPAEARQSIGLRRALASWDFKAASALADSLEPKAVALDAWMGVDEIREGGVVAKLKLGDPIAARNLWVAMASVATRPPDALRSLLLKAYLIDACDKVEKCKKAARR
ncbi:MAG: fused MFS/spermidine synthase [Gemmatimonadota bacterium]|nr:fused MFS/spermidine synthase [Gemmatimonadota bacterium]